MSINPQWKCMEGEKSVFHIIITIFGKKCETWQSVSVTAKPYIPIWLWVTALVDVYLYSPCKSSQRNSLSIYILSHGIVSTFNCLNIFPQHKKGNKLCTNVLTGHRNRNTLVILLGWLPIWNHKNMPEVPKRSRLSNIVEMKILTYKITQGHKELLPLFSGLGFNPTLL